MAFYLYRRRVWLIAIVLAATVPAHMSANQPLWPGSRFTRADRARALDRGLAFIYRSAADAANFERFGSDYLWCFYEISSTSADPHLSAEAGAMGRERAIQWRKRHRHVASSASADEVAEVLFGAYAVEKLGFADDALKQEIRRAASRFTSENMLRFDVSKGPDPAAPGLFDVLCDALITTYTADQYGVTLGAPYHDAAKWLPLARPYRDGKDGLIPLVNLVTHVVYTTNDYGARTVARQILRDEFAFLESHVSDREVTEDGELLGEFMDTLRAFGMTLRDQAIQRGFEELLSKQNEDGSWGDPSSSDIYDRYHPTWTAIDGLREYRWER